MLTVVAAGAIQACAPATTDIGGHEQQAPDATPTILTFASLAAGYQTMCGLTLSGAGYCWGANDGAIGDGTLDRHSTPVAVAGGLAFRSITSGTGYSCGVATSNALYCWGDNSDGALGDGTILSHPTPAPVRWPVDHAM